MSVCSLIKIHVFFQIISDYQNQSKRQQFEKLLRNPIQSPYIMNLNSEEQILIKDIFNVTVDHNNPGGAFLLHEFTKEVQKLGPDFSLIQHNTYFDSLLMERLQIPGTEILAYLEDCLNKCHYVVEKPWNQNDRAQNFINYSIQIIKNFIFLSLQQPQIFSEQLEIDSQANKQNNQILSIAMKVLSHFEKRGYNAELLNIIYPKIEQQVGGDFAQTLLEVLCTRQRFQTILQSKSFFYLTLLLDLIMIPEFKKKFINMKNMPFVPASFQKLKGSMIDSQSPFGLFARTSVLGTNPGFFFQQKEIIARFEQRMMAELGKQNLTRDRVKYYTDLQYQFYEKLTEIYKVLLKKDSQRQILDWTYALIYSNLKKAKLGSRIQGSNNAELSHDGLVMNAYMVLLNLCKPFLSRQGQKWKNIDPEYYMFKTRALGCKYEAIHQDKRAEKMEMQKQFGTITQFFFLCLELMNVGLVSVQDSFVQFNEYKEKLDKQKSRIPQNHPLYKKIIDEISNTQSKMVRYYTVLMDERMIKGTVKLLDMLMFLLPKWLNIDYNQLRHGKIKGYKVNEMASFLPEHFLQNIYKFHLTSFKFKQNYLALIGENHIHDLLKLTCLLLSDEEISSNPYMAGNFVELIFYFLQQTKSGLMSEALRINELAHLNLTNGLIRFYCDIAVTGSSHQFYSKFKYRFYVNKIFTSLWNHQVYRANLTEYFELAVFEKFLNMVMTDTTYCFDQANSNYTKYKELEEKKENGQLSEEDKKNQEQLTIVISSTLEQSTSNLRLMRALSAWSPQTFLSGAEISTVVPLMNNILKTFVDPTTFVANRQLLTKHKFQREIVLSDLLQMYTNLDKDERLSNEIVKDGRSYKKEYFSKALQKASNEHYTGVDILEKFQNLINKLSTTVNEEQDEQIYGEIPEKYLCALMSTLMKDPVLLPGSGNIVDRINIKKSLLIDERDPFTRAPLKYTELISQDALREEIEMWKKKRLEELKKGGKEIKYGNIQNNKREMDEGIAISENFLENPNQDDD